MGLCYQNGTGVEANQDHAMYFYQKAADVGDPDACYAVGYMYENGLSVDADRFWAIHYYSRAKSHPQAVAALQRLQGSP